MKRIIISAICTIIFTKLTIYSAMAYYQTGEGVYRIVEAFLVVAILCSISYGVLTKKEEEKK